MTHVQLCPCSLLCKLIYSTILRSLRNLALMLWQLRFWLLVPECAASPTLTKKNREDQSDSARNGNDASYTCNDSNSIGSCVRWCAQWRYSRSKSLAWRRV